MCESNIGSRMVEYIQSADMDPEGNVTVQGPTGFRVIVPPSIGIRDAHPDPTEAEGPLWKDYSGRYVPLLRGRIVFGPQPKRFLFSVFVFIFLLILLVIQAPDVVRECGNGVMAFGLALHLISLVTFFIICLSDPGVIPENYRLSELIWDTEGYRGRNPEARFYRYCQTCRGFRPPRSKHCESCDICIRDHETHLIVGGTCVGQRTARSFIILSLTVGLLTLYIAIVNSMIIRNAPPRMEVWRKVLAFVSLGCGILLLFTPQLGIILFLFRLFLVGNGYTGSSFVHRNNDWITCPLDRRSMLKQYWAFIQGRKAPSIFRKKICQIHPEAGVTEDEHAEEWLSILSLPAHRLPLIQELVRIRAAEQQSRWWVQRRQRLSTYLNRDTLNNNYSPTQQNKLLSEILAVARPKFTPSDPQLYSGELDTIPSQRLRRGIKSQMVDTLHHRMEDSQKRRKSKSPRNMKNTIHSSMKGKCPLDLDQITLSEGSIPRLEETRYLVSIARANQYRRLIHLVLMRDREGLEEMGRTVDIPALLGVHHFDPDNFQFVELSNGLPMLAPRREHDPRNLQNRVNGLLGIPQMVAAGLLPPARQLAQDMERTIGPGSIRRIPNPGTNRFVYQALRSQSRVGHGLHHHHHHHPVARVPTSNFPLLDSNPAFLALLNGHQDTLDRFRRMSSWGFPPPTVAPGMRRSQADNLPQPFTRTSSTPATGGLNAILDVENNNDDNNENIPFNGNNPRP